MTQNTQTPKPTNALQMHIKEILSNSGHRKSYFQNNYKSKNHFSSVFHGSDFEMALYRNKNGISLKKYYFWSSFGWLSGQSIAWYANDNASL